MEQIIQFRASIETFDKYEFELFCNKLYDAYTKRDLIIESLFHLLIDDSKHNKYENVIKINSITKNIMDLRKKRLSSQFAKNINNNNSSDDNNTNITMNDLASPLIAHTASYLSLSEQTSLIKCNRHIFSSLTSSISTIQTLYKQHWFREYKQNYGPHYNSYQTQKLNRFRTVKEIIVNPDLINELFKSFPFNNLYLEKLCLRDLSIEGGSGYKRHIAKTLIILKQIRLKQLSFQDVWIEDEKDATNYFVNLIDANKNIECLSLQNISSRNIDQLLGAALSKVEKKLKGLIINIDGRNAYVRSDVLTFFGDQLLSLHLRCFGIRIGRGPNTSYYSRFTSLQELCVGKFIHRNVLLNIIHFAKHLQRLCWEIFNVTPNDIFRVFQTLISERKDFKYLDICTLRPSVFNYFEKLNDILRTNKYKKNNMKIRWNFHERGIMRNLRYLNNNLLKFVNSLNESVRNDFMLILELPIRDRTQFNEIIPVLKAVKSSYSIKISGILQKNVGVLKQIIICNKNNRMCGYHERWLYSCAHCNK